MTDTTLIKMYTLPVPAVPFIPSTPPHDAYDEIVWTPETICFGGGSEPVYGAPPDPPGGSPIIILPGNPGACYTRLVPENVHHPFDAGNPGQSAAGPQAANNFPGWNASARSQYELVASGQYTFKVPLDVQGVVTGLTHSAGGLGYADIEYALYCTGGAVTVVERGAPVVATRTAYSDGSVLGIVRLGKRVKYFIDDVLLYTSLVDCTPGNMFVEASLYYGRDSIVHATLVDDVDPALAGMTEELHGILPGIGGFLSLTGGADMHGVLQDISGEFDGFSNTLLGILPGIRSSMAGGGLDGVLEGTLGNVVGTFDANQLIPTVGDLFGVLPGISGLTLGLVGTVGGVTGVLPGIQGYLTNVGYAVWQGHLGGIVGLWGTPTWILPQQFKMHVTMTCGLLVQRTIVPPDGSDAMFTVRPTMTCGLLLTRQLRATMSNAVTMTCGLQVTRQLRAAMTMLVTMDAVPLVQRVLQAEADVEWTMAAGLDVTRVLRATMPVRTTMTCRLHVQREITVEKSEIVVTPSLNDVLVSPAIDGSVDVRTEE